MSQEYNRATSHIYNQIWGEHAQVFGRNLQRELSAHNVSPGALVIDLACGTGVLAESLCTMNFRVVGIDCSIHMLTHAQNRCQRFVKSQSAAFVCADIASKFFSNETDAALVTCSYNSINHLDDLDALYRCFAFASDFMANGALIVFDINTAQGLEKWDRILVNERKDYTVFSRGFYDRTEKRAWKKFSGYRLHQSGLYERFEQIIFNTAFTVDQILDALSEASLRIIAIYSWLDWTKNVSDPENHDTIVVVAQRNE
jgi:SAM-dependent methyltransferase